MASKTVYIILFRGVGGATQLPTAPLRAALTDAGFENVATYINSGNAVLRSGLTKKKLIARVTAICRQQFGFQKAVFALTRSEWEAVIQSNPFPHAVDVPKFLHAAVLESPPTLEAIAKIESFATAGERFEVVNQIAYLHTPNGFGTSKMAAKFDQHIGVTNTARNWNTVVKLFELATGGVNL